mgnify:CR=1 FL=1
MIKPLFSYYGGKQRLASKILKHFPPHSVYVEPFAGGAALLFAKPVLPITNGNHYREVLNDTNSLISITYRYCRDNPDAFERLIEFTPYGKEVYSQAMKICKNPDAYTDKEIAWAFFVNINQSFSKKLNGGWGRSVCGGNNSSDWESRRKALKETLQRLKSVFIEKTNALDCITKWDSPQTLFYVDPPYPDSNQGHYGGYTIDDFAKLCRTLDGIQGSYVLSNYDQKDVFPATATRVEMETHCSASGKGRVGADRSRKVTTKELGDTKRTEVLWICDRSGNIREDLKKVVAKNYAMLQENVDAPSDLFVSLQA